MGMSDKIEAFINELLKDDTDEWLELKRNELASIFGCVPSQINYVISTRFNPDHGYIVESRRGGGSCFLSSLFLRIKQVKHEDGIIMQTIKAVGESLDEKTAKSYLANLIRHNALDERTASIIFSGICDNSLIVNQPQKDKVRANIFKNMLAMAGK